MEAVQVHGAFTNYTENIQPQPEASTSDTFKAPGPNGMVLRRTSEPTNTPEASMASSSPHGTVEAPTTVTSSTRNSTPLYQDLSGLQLDGDQGKDGVEDSSEDDNSDWDASDREDEQSSKAPQPPTQGTSAIPTLNVETVPPPVDARGRREVPTPSLTVSPPEQMGPGIESSSPSRHETNPFRRPTDYKPLDAFQDTSIWGEEKSTAAISTPQPVVPPESASLSLTPQEQAVNPFASEPSRSTNEHTPAAPVQSDPSDLISLDPENPWGGEPGAGKQSTPKVSGEYTRGPPPPPIPERPSVQSEQGPREARSKDQHTGASRSASRSKAPQSRTENYQIRNIRWHDIKSSKNPRLSPVLIQNANGPCPLLALVNALSLSTPPDMQTPLIETLRTREQVSLGLLLEAVFDELMSGRRGGTAQELPDVGELHAFLVTLHTGMNVNPRFVADEGPGQMESSIGGFEPTREMRLYSTFAIPLVHGWTPSRQDEAFAAFSRTAQTYEDAQNMQFQEQEIERKLGTNSVTVEEQALLMDLTTIKDFFGSWPTQLTNHGLESIQRELTSGQIVILFRNDHFSTVLKEPSSGQLMTLVTDAGYATHDEIVWENLVDINGSRSEMFAGDFKSVSHVRESGNTDSRGWTTVKPQRGSRQQTRQDTSEPADLNTSTAASAAATEQEDHDLALAMQLQEEEEQRHRNDQAARRRREDELSQQYLSQDSNTGPEIPPRRNGRPVATHREQEEDPDLPSYEQAASTRVYHPPPGHPASAQPLPQQNPGPQPGSFQPSVAASAVQQPQPLHPTPPIQSMSGSRRGGRYPGAGRIPGSTPFDNQRRNQTAYDATADRREGCMIM